MKRIAIRLPAALCAALLLLAACPAQAAPENLFAKMNTTDLSIKAFDAGIFSKRPTLLYLWASGRSVCTDELKGLQAISREYAGRMNLVGVLLDAVTQDGRSIDQAALTSAKKSLNAAGASFPNIIGSPELYGLMNSLGVSAVPTVWFVDTGGAVLYQSVGALGADGYRELIDDLLAGHSAQADIAKDQTIQHNLYFDDFESGSRHWALQPGWKLVQEGSNTALQGTGHVWAVLKEGSWRDYAFSARFKLSSGTIHFSFRRSEVTGGLNRYFVGVDGNNLYLHKQAGNSFDELASARLRLDRGWHEIRIAAAGGLINVSVDGKLRLVHEDRDPIVSGGIAFETLDNSVCLVDEAGVASVTAGDLRKRL